MFICDDGHTQNEKKTQRRLAMTMLQGEFSLQLSLSHRFKQISNQIKSKLNKTEWYCVIFTILTRQISGEHFCSAVLLTFMLAIGIVMFLVYSQCKLHIFDKFAIKFLLHLYHTLFNLAFFKFYFWTSLYASFQVSQTLKLNAIDVI